jgi:hypothetical protein
MLRRSSTRAWRFARTSFSDEGSGLAGPSSLRASGGEGPARHSARTPNGPFPLESRGGTPDTHSPCSLRTAALAALPPCRRDRPTWMVWNSYGAWSCAVWPAVRSCQERPRHQCTNDDEGARNHHVIER